MLNEHPTWQEVRARVAAVLAADWTAFYRDPLIAGQMVHSAASSMAVEWPAVRESRLYQLLASALAEPACLGECGRPAPNLVHQAYHLVRAGGRLDRLDLIVELGAGYGAMARLVRALGFRGRYVICDLPELCALQQRYLVECGIEDGVDWAATAEDLASVLSDASVDLMLAFWSLSELPLAARRPVLEAVRPRSIEAAFQADYHGLDNAAWFAADPFFRAYRMHRTPICHVPGSFYYFGVRE